MNNIKAYTRIDFNKRKNEEFYRKANAVLNNYEYVSKLNNWNINFTYKIK